MSVFANKQFLSFLITGGFAALVNFLSRIALNQWLSFSWSVVLAYGLGMVTAFVLAKAFVFTGGDNSLKRSALYFTLINVVAVAQTWLVSTGLAFYAFPSIGFDWHPNEVAHAIGVMVPVFSSYLGHKHLTFR
jgi:putative flippase GtrA